MLVRLTQASMMPVRAYAAFSASPPPRQAPVFSSAASYIWFPGAPEAAAPFFRKEFRLEANPKAAELRITADDSYIVYVNGKEAGRGDRCLLIQEYDVSKDLVIRRKSPLCARPEWRRSRGADRGADPDRRLRPQQINRHGSGLALRSRGPAGLAELGV